MFVIFFASARWNTNKVVEADVVSYYSYLPAVFVYGDISMSYAIADTFFSDKVWGVYWKEGMGPVQKYTMGMAYAYLPFFLGGHVVAQVFDYPVNGYSKPYRFALQLSSLFFLLIGLIFLRKVLLRYYSDTITALILLLLTFGSNLFYYSLGQGPMPHVYLFCLISILLYCTIRFYEAPSWQYAILIGLIGGWITLIRPNHMMIWLIPALYGVYNGATLKLRLRLFWTEKWKFLAWPTLVFLVILPQLFYWKYLTENWLYYSYGEEGFFFLHPQFLKTLFSFRNGWLIYSPIMVLGVIGLFRLRRYSPAFGLAIPLHFILSLYIISSWWCWWYGGNFGNRVFIDLYPMLGLGMGAILTGLGHRLTPALRWAGLGIASLFLLLNLFQTLQYSRGLIHYDAMTPAAYRAIFGKLEAPPGLENLFEHPNYEKAKKGVYE